MSRRRDDARKTAERQNQLIDSLMAEYPSVAEQIAQEEAESRAFATAMRAIALAVIVVIGLSCLAFVLAYLGSNS